MSPPQPLSRVRPNCSISIVPPGALAQRPALAAKVMEVIGIWASIDFELLSMTTNFLKSDYRAVAAMLNTLTSAEARYGAIAAAASTALSADDLKLFTLVHDTTKASRTRRHEFAHHVWAYCPDDLSDALFLIDPKYLSSQQAAKDSAFSNLRKRPFLTKEDIDKIPKRIDYAKVFVHRSADLDRDIDDAKRAFRLHNQLNYALSDFHLPPEIMSQREKVCAELFALRQT